MFLHTLAPSQPDLRPLQGFGGLVDCRIGLPGLGAGHALLGFSAEGEMATSARVYSPQTRHRAKQIDERT